VRRGFVLLEFIPTKGLYPALGIFVGTWPGLVFAVSQFSIGGDKPIPTNGSVGVGTIGGLLCLLLMAVARSNVQPKQLSFTLAMGALALVSVVQVIRYEDYAELTWFNFVPLITLFIYWWRPPNASELQACLSWVFVGVLLAFAALVVLSVFARSTPEEIVLPNRGLLGLFLDSPSREGWFGGYEQTAYLGVVAVTSAAFSSRLWRLLSIVPIYLCLASDSRSVLLGAVVGIVWTLWLTRGGRQSPVSALRLSRGYLAGVSVLLFSSLIAGLRPSANSHFRTFVDGSPHWLSVADSVSSGRLSLWLLSVGVDTTNGSVTWLGRETENTKAIVFSSPHNSLLEAWSSGSVVLISSVMLFFAAVVFYVARTANCPENNVLPMLLVPALVLMLFSNWIWAYPTASGAVFCFALCWGNAHVRSSQSISNLHQ